jgi:hypothetical protein
MSNTTYQNFKYLVYKHTCIISKKSYIGYTSKTMEERFSGHLCEMKYGSTYAFHNALRKYGKENFKSEILYVCYSKKDASYAEIELINAYDTKNNGYNETYGGENPPVKSGVSHYKSKKITIDNIDYVSLTDVRKRLNTNQRILKTYLDNFSTTISFSEFNRIRRKISSININGIEYINMNDACKQLNVCIDMIRAFLKIPGQNWNTFCTTYGTRFQRKRKIIINNIEYKSRKEACLKLNMTSKQLKDSLTFS